MPYDDTSYFDSEDFKEALQRYETALNEGGSLYMDADDLTDIAEYYSMKDRKELANQAIQLATELHPDAIEPQIFLARQQMSHYHLDKARSIATRITDQNNREVKFLWADIYIRENQVSKANKLLEEYYETLDEDRADFLFDTAYIFLDYKELAIAMQWAKRIQQEFPHDKRTPLLMCDILISDKQSAKAVSRLNAILAKDAFNEDAWLLLADAECQQEHYHEALDAIDYLLAINEHHTQGHLIRADVLYHLKRMNEAHKQYEKYFEQIKDDAHAYYMDSLTLSNMNRFEEAQAQVEHCIRLCEPASLELSHAFLQLSYVQNQLGQNTESIHNLDKAFEAISYDKNDYYYLLKGHILMESKDIQGAKECFMNALSKSKDANATRLSMAIMLAENEHYDKSRTILEGLMKTNMPDKEARCLPYLAYCTYFSKDTKTYKSYLHQAAKSNPSLTESLFAPIYPNIPITEYDNI